MSDLKTKPTSQSVENFLDNVVDEARRRDCYDVLEMMKAATGADPVLWGTSIVGFGKYRYKYASGREGEWPVIGFSPRKNDLTLYILPGFERYDDLMTRLGKYKTGKSCLYIRKLEQIDRKVLQDLIDASVEAMAEKRIDT